MKTKYKSVKIIPCAEGYSLILEGKPACTPYGNAYIIPETDLAQALADEWRRQPDGAGPASMPLTQMANVALDLAAARKQALLEEMLPYADTDLICYRAGDIPELLARQAEWLDALIMWAERRFGITLAVTQGVMPVAQAPGNKTKLRKALEAYDDWKLAVLAVTVKPLGSLVIALALIERRLTAKQAFNLSHMEEHFEAEKWGRDDEQASRLQKLEEDILAAERFLALL